LSGQSFETFGLRYLSVLFISKRKLAGQLLGLLKSANLAASG
jgi:hypothetical protein